MKKTYIWRSQNNTFAVSEGGSGMVIDRKIIFHLYHENGRETAQLEKIDSTETICGHWTKVGEAQTTWPDNDWFYVKMSPETYEKFKTEFLGFK